MIITVWRSGKTATTRSPWEGTDQFLAWYLDNEDWYDPLVRSSSEQTTEVAESTAP